jgi:hypothetical protein
MDWIESESVWVVCPDFADVFVWREAFEGLETPAEIVGVDEVGEMALELPVAVGSACQTYGSCTGNRPAAAACAGERQQ